MIKAGDKAPAATGTAYDGRRFDLGARVGVPWLGGTCGRCAYCRAEPTVAPPIPSAATQAA